MTKIREIQASDNAALKDIIQSSLKAYGLDIEGTAYFDPELAHLSDYYGAEDYRDYFVAVSDAGEVYGGAGFAEYDLKNKVAELQKLYLSESARGQGLSYKLIDQVVAGAKAAGYQQLYLETQHKLASAVHVYQKYGFQELDAPIHEAQHSAMDKFFILDL
ncbi:GNAT family N-acetyltransferase [Leuconostocaceae bacterium ESL0723]|nr:GNAT family N-acetyltransferase [Leuconostocaceae bacterium ESL0723]